MAEKYAKFHCDVCNRVNLHEREPLFEMIEKAGFTLCTQCGAPARFEARQPNAKDEWQASPVPLTPVQMLAVPHQVYLWMRARFQGIQNENRRILQQPQQGQEISTRTAFPR